MVYYDTYYMKKVIILLLSIFILGCVFKSSKTIVHRNAADIKTKPNIVDETKSVKTDAKKHSGESASPPPPPPVGNPAPGYTNSASNGSGGLGEETYTNMMETSDSIHVEKTRKKEKKNPKEIATSAVPITIGRIVYKIPDTMVVYTNYVVVVRISKDKNLSNITVGFDFDGKVKDTAIKTTSKMDVTITDSSPDSSFVIHPINNSVQLVDSDSYTQWTFSIKPIKHGIKKLDLVVSVIKDGDKKQVVYTDAVVVKDAITKDVKAWWQKYWQWSITTFAIPIFIYFWKRKKKDSDTK